MEITLHKDTHMPTAGAIQREELLSFRDIFAVLQRHRKLILFCAIAGVILGLISVAFTVPRYTATTSILIDPNPHSALPDNINSGMSMRDHLVIDSQIEVIKSTRMMDRVAEKAGIYNTTGIPTKSWRTRIKEMILGVPETATEVSEAARIRQAKLAGFMGGLNVRRVRSTYVIEISYTSGNAQQSEKIANLIADVYLDNELEARYESSERAKVWLKQRLDVLQKELATTEGEVETYKQANGITTIDNRNMLSEQQLSELNRNLIVARAESAQAKARLENIETIISSGNPETATTDVMNNRVISELRSKYIELSRFATEILRRQGKDHQAYRNLLQQMNDIQTLIWSEYRRMAQSYKSEYEIAKSKENTLKEELDAVRDSSAITSISQIPLREMQRQAESTRGLYTRMLDKANEETERQALTSVNAHVISYATAPMVPSWPNKRLMLMTSLGFGVIAGVGLAFLREQFEKFLWKAEDIEAASHRTCLGMLPKVAFDREKVVHFTKRWSTKELSVAELPSKDFNRSGFDEVTQLLEKQTGVITEIMRNVQLATQTSKDLSQPTQGRVISFVSARPGEGKSITSCFLAKHLARTGMRVALIDCDFRRPSLSHWFLPGATTGFYELASRIGMEDPKNIAMDMAAICRKTGQENLFFIPAKGSNTSISNLNLVGSGQMHGLITYMRQVFDVILIDLPPIMNIVDARVIANSIDSFILLAHWGKTDRSIVSKALHRAPEVYAKTVGSLLTLVDTEKASRYGYYNYNYYYYYHHQPS